MGKRPQLDWAKLPLVDLSQVTAPWGGSPSTYICRNRHDCIWTKLHWVELSQVTARGSPLTYLCRDRHDCIWTKLPRVGFLNINNKLLLGEKSP